MANIGEKVKLKTLTEEEEGIIMPSSDDKVVTLKLTNGYNVGFEKKNILSMQTLNKKEPTDIFPHLNRPLSEKKEFKTIMILHCGGTIASKVDYNTGAVVAKFSPEELLEMFPELGEISNIRSKLVANMMSENMRFAHYNLIAKEIDAAIKEKVDGIIITHGTDTLHYTAAALSFALENLPIPVLLVGAQRSSDRGSSDAFMNLKCAAQFIAKSDFVGVAVCMHAHGDDDVCVILPGTKCRKMHSSRRDAFHAVNAQSYAFVDEQGKIEWKVKEYPIKISGKFALKLFNEDLKIGIIKAHPNMYAEEISAYNNFDGVVLEGTGLGHFPIEKSDDFTLEHEKIFEALKHLASKIPVVMTLQTIFGGVNMNVYSPGRRQMEAGVLGNGLDMPPETAFIKLAWLLSNYPRQVKEMFGKNLQGEVGVQRSYKSEFINN